MNWTIRYWVNAAREQNRWRIGLRIEAMRNRVKRSGPLFDAARRCRDRRDIFIAEARRAKAQAGAA